MLPTMWESFFKIAKHYNLGPVSIDIAGGFNNGFMCAGAENENGEISFLCNRLPWSAVVKFKGSLYLASEDTWFDFGDWESMREYAMRLQDIKEYHKDMVYYANLSHELGCDIERLQAELDQALESYDEARRKKVMSIACLGNFIS